MKRFAAIAVIAALMLTMSVGTAYAGVCVGMACSDTALKCAEPAPKPCGTDAARAYVHSGCHQAPERDTKYAVGVQPALSQGLPASSFVPVEPALTLGILKAASAADARGAPHLTAVIRI